MVFSQKLNNHKKFTRLAKALIRQRLCWSHIPLSWKSHALAHFHSDGFSHTYYTISMNLSILYFKGWQAKYLNFNTFLSLTVFILTNSADPNEMVHYAAFLHGLHCLPTVSRMKLVKAFNSGHQMWELKRTVSSPKHI